MSGSITDGDKQAERDRREKAFREEMTAVSRKHRMRLGKEACPNELAFFNEKHCSGLGKEEARGLLDFRVVECSSAGAWHVDNSGRLWWEEL